MTKISMKWVWRMEIYIVFWVDWITYGNRVTKYDKGARRNQEFFSSFSLSSWKHIRKQWSGTRTSVRVIGGFCFNLWKQRNLPNWCGVCVWDKRMAASRARCLNKYLNALKVLYLYPHTFNFPRRSGHSLTWHQKTKATFSKRLG